MNAAWTTPRFWAWPRPERRSLWVWACVCMRARVFVSSGPHVMSCLQPVRPLFSPPPSPLLFLLLSFSSVSLQSGNADHRGLTHCCRVSPSSPAPFFGLWRPAHFCEVIWFVGECTPPDKDPALTPLPPSVNALKSPRGVDRVRVIKL